MEWADLSGSGVVESFTVVYIPLSTTVGRTPYAVAVVKLDDGPSVSGLVLDVDDGEKLQVGSRVEAVFVKEGEKTSLCFKLA